MESRRAAPLFVCVLCHAKPLFCVEVTPPVSGNINNMCGGAIISDFISAKRGRTLTAEDLWSEFDTISDLLGLDHSSSNNNNNNNKNKDQFEHQQNNTRVAQKPKPPLSKGAGTSEKSKKTSPGAGAQKEEVGKAIAAPAPAPATRPLKKRCVVGPAESTQSSLGSNGNCCNYDPFEGGEIYGKKEVGSEYELKEQISSLESFLGLDEEEASEVNGSGGGEPKKSLDLWMLGDLVTHHQQQQQQQGQLL
ncbi:hypothetical protein ACE6H2_001237 [Prunus campanulata]